MEFKEDNKQMLSRLRKESTFLEKSKNNQKYKQSAQRYIETIQEYTQKEIEKLEQATARGSQEGRDDRK